MIRRYEISGVQCVDASGGNATYIEIDQATIRLDATWAPYIQATLSGPPPSAAELTAIEPRDGWRIRFDVKAYDETGTQLGATLHCDLGIRTRDRTFSATPRMTITAASDEARLQDFADGTTADPTGISAYASDFAQAQLSVLGWTLTVVPGAPNVIVDGADAINAAGTSFWDYMAGLAEASGARIWIDESDTLRWSSPTWSPDTSMHYLDAGIVDVTDSVSRDDAAWANYAVVAYTRNTPTQYVSDGVTATTRKAISIQRERRKPAGNAATKIRANAQKRGRNLTVRALADLSMRPNQSWTVSYQGQTWSATVQSVEWEIQTGAMTAVFNVIEA